MGLHMTGSTVTQLNNAYVGRWQTAHVYLSGDLALAPDGTIIQRNADGTSRGTYDATEQAAWTVKAGIGASASALNGVATTATADGAVTIGKHNPVDATSGNRTMTLADAASVGLMVSVSKKDATAHTVTVSVSHLRDTGAGSITLVGQFEALMLVSKADGSWWPVGDHKTKAYLDATYANKTAANTFTGRGKQYIQGDQSQHLDHLFEVGDALPMGPPSPPTVVSGGAGGLTGVYQYVIAETDAVGVTTPSTAVSITLAGEQATVTVPYRRPGSIALWVYRTSAGGSDFKRVFYFGGGYDYHQRTFTDNLADASRSSVVPQGSDTTRGFGFRADSNGMLYASHSIDADPAANFTYLNVDGSNGGSWAIDAYGPIVARTALGHNFYAIHAGTTGYGFRLDYISDVSTAVGPTPTPQAAVTTFYVQPDGGIVTTIAPGSVRTGLTIENPTIAMKINKTTGAANPSWQMDADGKQLWGAAAATPDVNLYRRAAGVVGTDYALNVGSGTGAGAAIHDFLPPSGSTDASVAVRTASGTNLRITASNTTATGATIQTLNNTPVSIAANGVTSLKLLGTGTVLVGKASMATTATDGYPYIPAVAGAPTGVPTAQTGYAAHIYDTTNHKLWVYDGGWKGVVLS